MSENGFDNPHGDEVSPEVYRRRRIVALIAILLVLLLLIWGVVSIVKAIGGGSEDTADSAPSTSTSAEPFSDFSDRASESPSESTNPSDGASGSSESATDQASGQASEEPGKEETDSTATSSAEPTQEATPSEKATPSQEATPEATPTTEAAPVACSATDMSVALTADKGSYGAGENPAMAITYTNNSGNPCNIGGEGQTIDINITSGSAQVYNYAQCNNAATEAAELAAGAAGTKVITWDRSLNALGCETKTSIQPGYYWATATVNGVTSEPTRIIVSG